MNLYDFLEGNKMENENRELQEGLFLYEKSFENIRAESPDELIDNHKALFSIMETLPNGVTILTTNFKVIYTNKKMRAWFTRNRHNYKIKCYRLFHNDQKVPCEKCPATVCMKTKASASVIHDCGIDEKTGEPMFMHIYVFPILNTRGDIIALIEYSYNLTEQRKIYSHINELESYCALLEQENNLLKKALEDRQKSLQDLEDNVNNNMNHYVKPALEFLKTRITPEEQKIVTSLIEESIFPITKRRTSKALNLSARELQVAMMIKDGLTSKEIASELCITKKAVDYHRSNIRKKLKIDLKVNLQSYLKAYL